MDAPLAIFVLHESLELTAAPALTLIHRNGFDLLDVFDCVLPAHTDSLLRSVDRLQKLQLGAGHRCRAFIVVDLCPWQPAAEIDPAVCPIDNNRLRRLDDINKLLRRIVESGSSSAHDSYLAATPNSAVAWQLLDELGAGSSSKYREEIHARQRAMTPPFPVLKDVTAIGNNAKTYVVAYRKEAAICKVFRPGRQKELRNELRGLDLASIVPEIPRCLEKGDNWLVTEYIADATPLSALKNRSGLIPLGHARRALTVLRAIHDAGLAHLDFRPEHVLITPGGRLWIIDFDRTHRYANTPPFEQSLPIVGYDDTRFFEGPNGPPPTYASVWQPYVGLGLASLLHDPLTIQHSKRAIFTIRRASRSIGRRLRRLLLGSLHTENAAPSAA